MTTTPRVDERLSEGRVNALESRALSAQRGGRDGLEVSIDAVLSLLAEVSEGRATIEAGKEMIIGQAATIHSLRRTVERQQAELDVLRDTKLGMAWVQITHENADLKQRVSQQQAVVEAAERLRKAWGERDEPPTLGELSTACLLDNAIAVIRAAENVAVKHNEAEMVAAVKKQLRPALSALRASPPATEGT